MTEHSGETMLRQYFKRKDYIELKALNPKYKTIRSKEVEIVREVVRVIKRV